MDDAERIALLYRQHVGAARALAITLTADQAAAEDITQEAFLRCAARLGRLREPEKFGSYLFRAVIHSVIDESRRKRVERQSWRAAAAGQPSVPDIDARLFDVELLAALQQLPPRQRAAVTARFLLDWSEAQTAAAMGCRVGTVKSLTSRGLVRLREQLGLTEDISHD